MSIRDIIAAAWEVYDDRASLMVTWRPRCKESAVVMEDYRRIVHPEHVALMEAVCEAAARVGSLSPAIVVMDDALDRLQAYRKEHGL